MNLNNTLQMGLDNKLLGQAQSAARTTPASEAKVRDMAKQFESFFLFTTLEQMSEGLTMDKGLMGGGHAEKIWRSTLNEKMSDVISNSSHRGFGIAQAIERQLLQYQEVKP